MKDLLKRCAVIVGVFSVIASAAPEVSFGGYLDADVWSDLTGMYYANQELDIGMSLKFTDNVSANVYATALGGAVPAGLTAAESRWVSFDFDGFDITFDTDIGSFSVGDLVYQFGGFNYYLYKRLSMITPESFTRGLSYSYTSGLFTGQLLAGIADAEGSNVADVQGVASLTFSESTSLGLYVGMQNDALSEFGDGTSIYAGASYNGAAGEMLSLKLDFGFNSFPGGEERTNVISVLFEPSISVGKFSTALTAFYCNDGEDDLNYSGLYFGLAGAEDEEGDPILAAGDEMFVYVEPGYSISDMLAVGLPLEYHAFNMADEDDNQFWVVPTFYVYPTDGVEWWLWGQMIAPITEEESELGWGVGSEIIVNF